MALEHFFDGPNEKTCRADPIPVGDAGPTLEIEAVVLVFVNYNRVPNDVLDRSRSPQENAARVTTAGARKGSWTHLDTA